MSRKLSAVPGVGNPGDAEGGTKEISNVLARAGWWLVAKNERLIPNKSLTNMTHQTRAGRIHLGHTCYLESAADRGGHPGLFCK